MSGIDAVLAATTGGHLSQLYNLAPWWSEYSRVWLTLRTKHSESLLEGESVFFVRGPTTRNLWNALLNFFIAFRILREQRPRLVVSTGAGLAVPLFLAARLLNIRTAYIEVIDRIDSASLSGRLCYPLSNLFLVQWPEQKTLYPRAIVVGPLI